MIKTQLAKKIKTVSLLQEKLSQAKTVIVFEYSTLPVSAFMQLRRQLKKLIAKSKFILKTSWKEPLLTLNTMI